jgi:hypothetical protein
MHTAAASHADGWGHMRGLQELGSGEEPGPVRGSPGGRGDCKGDGLGDGFGEDGLPLGSCGGGSPCVGGLFTVLLPVGGKGLGDGVWDAGGLLLGAGEGLAVALFLVSLAGGMSEGGLGGGGVTARNRKGSSRNRSGGSQCMTTSSSSGKYLRCVWLGLQQKHCNKVCGAVLMSVMEWQI